MTFITAFEDLQSNFWKYWRNFFDNIELRDGGVVEYCFALLNYQQ